MLMKWIKCQVNEENKRSFSKAQERWGQMRHCDGFIGQIGRWNRNEPCEAGILSVWKDLHCYQRFMLHQHAPRVTRGVRIQIFLSYIRKHIQYGKNGHYGFC